MKILTTCILFLLTGYSHGLAQQEIKEHVEMIIPSTDIDTNTIFLMKNIQGGVKVTGYEGSEILITGTKTVWKKRGEITKAEAEDFYLDRFLYRNKLCVYTQAPGVEINKYNGDLNYSWNNYGRNKNRTQFTFELELKVPHNLMSEISTVNGGEVFIENLSNGVAANNVNGNIFMKEIAGVTTAQTVNGNIRILFAESPQDDSDFQTVNGTIEIEAPINLSAVVTFQSLHGDLYTDFENIEHLPNRLNKTNDRGAKSYKIEQTAPVKIGKGGPTMSFHLVNGNAYIKQRKS